MGREAGARVRTHAALNNLNVFSVQPSDERRLEVVASGLPPYHGAQVAVDAALVSPFTRKGTARPRADWEDGAALKDAQKLKATTYPELQSFRRCKLVTAGMEVGGRWDESAYEFLLKLADAKAQQAPLVLRGSATRAWLKRWVALLSKAAMDSFASTLVYGTAENTELWNGPPPALGVVLCSAPEPPEVSRLGLR